MDPANHFAGMGQMAMERGDFPSALHFLSEGLEHCPRTAPQSCLPFLVQRAQCFWQLGQFQASVHDMEEAIGRGLPQEGNHAQWEMRNWTDHGFFLYQNRDFRLAERCVNIAFHFQHGILPEHAVQTFLCRGFIRYELNNEAGAQQDINIVKGIDSRLAEVGPKTEYNQEVRMALFARRPYWP